MNTRDFICLDLETSSANTSTAQILQIGAVAISKTNLQIIDEFYIPLIKPDNWDEVEDEALKVNKIDRKDLEENGLEMGVAWPRFVDWCRKFDKSSKKTGWDSPIACGYNVVAFDLPIAKRYCKRFGQWNEKRNNLTLFNPIYVFDIMQHAFYWFENNGEVTSLKLTDLALYMGASQSILDGGAHNALFDCKVTARIAIGLLRMSRYYSGVDENTHARRLDFKNKIKDWGV